MPNSPRAPVRHLWLLRHGKAASDAPWGGSDKERPLTARGRRDATALGRRLATERPVLGLEGVPPPALAICSAAVRTRQTADLVAKAMGGRLPVDTYRSLYEAGTEVALGYVREIDNGVQSALVVGHNPTVYQVAFELVGDGDDDSSVGDRAILESHGFPTCALAVLALDVQAWEDVVPGCGALTGVFKPPY
ncbi:MAG TPA: histidine phosphatase family protein [Acidimicrobiales bacterium]|nr:histidine phosphatase family protein [Acidimicrobiales bacterium]